MAHHIDIKPVGKPRMTQQDKWKKRPAVVRYREFCDKLRLALPDYDLPPELSLTFFIPMPKSWSARDRAAKLGSPHDQKPDIDNLAKAFMDAFKSEDKAVYSLYAVKYWSDVGAIEVEAQA